MRVILLSSVLMLAAMPAYAIDEFGDRFGTSAPLALGEDAAADLGLGAILGLEPAAGEEQESGEETDAEADKESSESEAEQDSESEGESEGAE
jgi:hypothetical protein